MNFYKYLIKKKNDNYVFGLYPNNSNQQYMIVSQEYATKEEAVDAINQFKIFMSKNINNSDIVRVIQKNDRFTFEIEDVENNKSYKNIRWYDNKINCMKGISCVQENFNAEIKLGLEV